MTPLAPGFVPGDDDVLVGRGKKYLLHTGNIRFKQIAATKLSAYLAAERKMDKTAIIMEVIAQVRINSPSGGFVTQNPETGQYFEVGDVLAKAKTSQAFRDALHEHYSSSHASKKKRHTKKATVISSTPAIDSKQEAELEIACIGNSQQPKGQQNKNTLETLIDNGAIQGDLANEGMKQALGGIQGDLANEWMKQALEDKANKGDVKAMEDLGEYYMFGVVALDKCGCGQNAHAKAQMAFYWLEKAHLAGSVFGTGLCGFMLAEGRGVAKDQPLGILYLCKAAVNGSAQAAYALGVAFAKGKYGLRVDAGEARGYLERVVSGNCTFTDLSQQEVAVARQLLNSLRALRS